MLCVLQDFKGAMTSDLCVSIILTLKANVS
jgi:hypothetical protein